jgi:EAL domain-containing protein (putative c-di-GMP-specific phosphodiesterase class I)/GGDEF domain-containing protein
MAGAACSTGSAATASLSEILGARRLETLFQPIFAFREARILGFEALVRGPEGSPFETPFALFGAAQREGTLVELNIVCIQETLRAYARVRPGGLLFLNISPQLIVRRGFDQARAARFLSGLGVEAEQVVIELTEDYPSFDVAAVRESLQLYRAMGFRVALDDLGEGSSTLRLWSELRPEFVKADKHFVTGIAVDPVKVQFLRAIQHIAESSGSRVIAEGIEGADDYRLVKELGIACGQGWFIGMPQRAPRAELSEAAAAAQRDARVSVPPHARGAPESSAKDLLRAPQEARAAPPALCVDAGLDLDALAAMLAQADDATLAEGFGVVAGGSFLGRARTQDVIRALQRERVLAERHTHPLTQLPGQVPAHEHLERLLARGVPFSAWLAEIDEMTGLNDAEGFARGDRLIHATARLLEAACEPGIDFVGHLGGTRFLALLQSEDWRERAGRAVREFPRLLEAQVSAGTFARGYFRGVERDGAPALRPLPRLVIGILPVLPGVFASRHEVLAAAKAAAQQVARGPASALHVDDVHANAYPTSLLLEA